MLTAKKNLWLVYLLGFLWSLSFAIPSYAQSSFIGSIVGVDNVGLVVFISNVAALCSILAYAWLIKKISNFKSAFLVGLINLLAVIFLYITEGVWSLVFYVVIFVTFNLFFINLDIFLESLSTDRVTGRLRTTLLTIMNVAFFFSPLLMGYIVGNGNHYVRAYIVAGVVFFPALLLLWYWRRMMQDHILYKKRSWRMLRQTLAIHENIPRIFWLEFTLRYFYATMVLYSPIYLHQYMGLGWQEIGWIFTIMLLPFILLEMPAGQLADRLWGEKEMLIFGISCMAAFTLLVVFLHTTSILLWGAVLFMTRVGAALVEAMNATYFFKHVNREDMDIINMFRDLIPIGWLSAALASFVVLHFLHMSAIFVVMVVVLVVALYPASKLVDTR